MKRFILGAFRSKMAPLIVCVSIFFPAPVLAECYPTVENYLPPGEDSWDLTEESVTREGFSKEFISKSASSSSLAEKVTLELFKVPGNLDPEMKLAGQADFLSRQCPKADPWEIVTKDGAQETASLVLVCPAGKDLITAIKVFGLPDSYIQITRIWSSSSGSTVDASPDLVELKEKADEYIESLKITSAKCAGISP